MNKYSQWLFTEFDKGARSPIVLIVYCLGFTALGYKGYHYYILPARENSNGRLIYSRLPFVDEHTSFFGFVPSIGAGSEPATLTARSEEMLARPRVIHAEKVADDDGVHHPGDMYTVMETTEFDPQYQDDVYYRSLHVIPAVAAPAPATSAVVQAPRMTGTGEHIESIIKCRALSSSSNNCVPVNGDVQSEVNRKMLLAVGPLFLLRDQAALLLPRRWSKMKEVATSIAVCGLKGGVLARTLANSYPNFNVTVIENDMIALRLARQWFGFQESTNLKVWPTDPISAVRRLAIEKGINGQARGPGLEAIFIDTVDHEGKLSTEYARLEFCHNVRDSLGPTGFAVINIPNENADLFSAIVSNWRLGFAGRTILLVHCSTMRNSILFAFRDEPEWGKARLGSVGSVAEFREVLNAEMSHYGRRFNFFPSAEIHERNFVVLEPSKDYAISSLLPESHPSQRATMAVEAPPLASKGLMDRLRQTFGMTPLVGTPEPVIRIPIER